MTAPALGHGLSFTDLYDRDGLARLDAAFAGWLQTADVDVHARLMAARAAPEQLAAKDESNLLIEVARPLEDFIGALFGVTPGGDRAARPPQRAGAALRLQAPVRAALRRARDQARCGDGARRRQGHGRHRCCRRGSRTDSKPGSLPSRWPSASILGADFKVETPTPAIEALTRYAAWALHHPEGKKRHRDGPLFKVPHKLDFEHLVPIETEVVDGVTRLKLPRPMLRHREGFALTDEGFDLVRALDHTNYCIWCHNQGKDSCSRGLRDRKTGAFQKSPFGVTLAGCPLEEKISEMNLLKSEGFSIGALAMAAVDNPLVAATGHRICNDCMKACIYQKQEPVDIPQIETRTLKDVLGLPWGFEIYSLLTRWNPLHLRRPIPRPATGRTVLVVGLGPAGFNLAHHLMNDGHTVVGIDGLKIEPLPATQSGVAADGARLPFAAVRDVDSLREDLGERAMAGFGGVAEYGITVRWDKNYLKMVRLLLERRQQFSMFGGVRFGGTVTVEGAFAMGFDHIALCAGAGKPTVLDLPNGLARGVRAASDFLMALQLTGAAKKDFDRQPADPPAGGGDRRRPHGHRHGDRIARLLPAAGREVSGAPRDPRCRARRGGGARRHERRGAGDRRRVHRPCRGDPGGARRGRARRPRARHRRAGERLGRRHHRLSPPADRFAVLYAQPRGSAEGAGGGHPLRRRPVAGRGRGRRQRPCQRAQGGGRAERPEDRGHPAGAHHPGGGRHPAQHRAGARGCDPRLHRRQVFPRARRGGQIPSRRRRSASLPRCAC